jgi:uncharacterized membrane protein
MRRFSVRPALTFRGRTFKGLRGWSGKPLHPPLTDIPIGAYLIAATLDVVSYVGQDELWATDAYRAATFVVTIGLVVAVFAALTGFWDWLRSTEPGTQARRTANAHAFAMVTVTLIVAVAVALRWFAYYDDPHTGVVVLVLSVVAALVTVLGAALGGELVFDYGFNVETAGDSPVWHRSEVDVLPFRSDDEPVDELPPRAGNGAPAVPEDRADAHFR